jgi:HSP20 family protein
MSEPNNDGSNDLINIFAPALREMLGHGARTMQPLTTFQNNNSSTPSNNSNNRSKKEFLDVSVDIINEPEEITIFVELPGLKKDQIDIKVYNNRITIMAEKRGYQADNFNSIPKPAERKFGKIERVITLPICVTRRDSLKSSLVDGVLKITINKINEEENRFNIKPE